MMENCLFLPSTVELGLKISENGLKLSTRREAGFEWLTKCTFFSFTNQAGRGSIGISKGKYYFEVKVCELITTKPYKGLNSFIKNECISLCA